MNGGLQPVAVTGTVRQFPYDPFRNEDRARAEELGDVLAEGIYWLLDQGRSLAEADEEYWAGFLVKRRQFIGRVLEMVKQDRDLHPEDRQRRITALSHGSMFRLNAIKPDLCAGYLRAWAEDRKRWEYHLDQLPAGLSPAAAIGWLPADGSRGAQLPPPPRAQGLLPAAAAAGPRRAARCRAGRLPRCWQVPAALTPPAAPAGSEAECWQRWARAVRVGSSQDRNRIGGRDGERQ